MSDTWYTPQSIAPILANGAAQQIPLIQQPKGALSAVLPAVAGVADQGFKTAADVQNTKSLIAARQQYADYLSKVDSGTATPEDHKNGYLAALSLGITPPTQAANKQKTRNQLSLESSNAIRRNLKLPESETPLYEDEVPGLKLATPAKPTNPKGGGDADEMKRAKMWQTQMNNIIPTIAKRGSPLGIAAVNNQRKDRLLEIAKNPNPTPQEVRLMETDLAGVMQGGSPQEDTLRATHYGSLYQDWAGFKGKITGTPQDANSPEIVSKLKQIALGVGSIDNKVITDNLSMIEKYPSMTYLIKRDPQGWSNFKQSMMGTLQGDDSAQNPSQGSAAPPHPQDSQAVSWAKANSDDPRAKKILALNGQ